MLYSCRENTYNVIRYFVPVAPLAGAELVEDGFDVLEAVDTALDVVTVLRVVDTGTLDVDEVGGAVPGTHWTIVVQVRHGDDARRQGQTAALFMSTYSSTDCRRYSMIRHRTRYRPYSQFHRIDRTAQHRWPHERRQQVEPQVRISRCSP